MRVTTCEPEVAVKNMVAWLSKLNVESSGAPEAMVVDASLPQMILRLPNAMQHMPSGIVDNEMFKSMQPWQQQASEAILLLKALI